MLRHRFQPLKKRMSLISKMNQDILNIIKSTQPFGRLQTPYSALKAYAACMCFSLKALGESDETIIEYFNQSLPASLVDKNFIREILSALKSRNLDVPYQSFSEQQAPEECLTDNQTYS